MITGYEHLNDEELDKLVRCEAEEMLDAGPHVQSCLMTSIHDPEKFIANPNASEFLPIMGSAIMAMAEKYKREKEKAGKERAGSN